MTAPNVPRCFDLIFRLEVSKVAAYGIAHLTPFRTSAASINYHDDVFQGAGKVVMPVLLKSGVNHLGVGAAVHAEQHGILLPSGVIHSVRADFHSVQF